MMIAGRVGQGLTGGAMIPTAQTIIATRLPRRQQPIGTAMFGATAILGPVVGPFLGGWLTENFSWHYAFFLNIPICLALVALLVIGLPHQKARLDLLGQADWIGILGLAAFLGAITIALEEGQREQWLSSPFIVWLFVISAVGLVLLLLGQWTAERPVIRLAILLDRQFGSVVVMGVVVGMVIYGTSYMIPQFLAGIAGYNALQSGTIVTLAGVPSLMLMPFVPLLIRGIDIRVAVAFGLGLLALSAHMETGLTALSSGGSFIDSQLLRGVGTIFAMLFLNQAAIQSVSREFASDAAGLFNAARNLGGSLVLAAISILQDQRYWFHSRRLEEALAANGDRVQEYLHQNGASALHSLASMIQTQALTMTYVDLFRVLSVGIVCVIPLVLFLRPLARNAPLAAH
ncbi:MAG: putative multidrug resistance protein EmrY [Xylophilus sp.]|nr:MAG: putative multidrug resistance protein EmrY [Xylophilus sp.]